MKHDVVLFIIGLIMIMATTAGLLLVPAIVEPPLDGAQALVFLLFGVIGYGGGALYIYVSKNWS